MPNECRRLNDTTLQWKDSTHATLVSINGLPFGQPGHSVRSSTSPHPVISIVSLPAIRKSVSAAGVNRTNLDRLLHTWPVAPVSSIKLSQSSYLYSLTDLVWNTACSV